MSIPILGGLLGGVGRFVKNATDNIATNSGLLMPQNEEEMKMMKSRALLGMGTAMLQGKGDFGSVLGQGIEAGQKAGADTYAGMQALEQQNRTKASRAMMQEKYADTEGLPLREKLTKLYSMFMDATRMGDTETARQLATVLNSLGSSMLLGGNRGRDPLVRGVINPDTGAPGLARMVTDPNTGEMVPEFIDDVEFPEITPYQRANLGQKDIDNVTGLHKEFFARRKEILPGELGTAIRTGLEVLPDAMQGDGLAQLTSVFAYLRLLDPKSVVREGEVENVVKRTAAVPGWLWKELMRFTGNASAVDAPEGTEITIGRKPPKGSAPLLASASMGSLARLFQGQVNVLMNTEQQLIDEMYGVAEDVLGLSPEEVRKKIRFRSSFAPLTKQFSRVNGLVSEAENGNPSVPPPTIGAGKLKRDPWAKDTTKAGN